MTEPRPDPSVDEILAEMERRKTENCCADYSVELALHCNQCLLAAAARALRAQREEREIPGAPFRCTRCHVLLEAESRTDDGADVLAATERAFDEPPPEIHRCRVCGTLWHRWQNGFYSLIENRRAKPCCDNVPMGGQIEKLWPKAEPAPEPAGAAELIERLRKAIGLDYVSEEFRDQLLIEAAEALAEKDTQLQQARIDLDFASEMLRASQAQWNQTDAELQTCRAELEASQQSICDYREYARFRKEGNYFKNR